MKRHLALALTGRTVLVTGAGSGIGAATSRALVARGANVVLVDLRQEPLDELAAVLGPQSLPVAADVTDRAAVGVAVAAAVARFGSLDVCFANAGIAASSPTTVRSSSEKEFERIIEVDVLGVWRTVRSCLPEVTKANGHILVTSSVYAFFNGTANAPYAMSKAAVESFGRSLRGELAGTGTTAGVLYPGWVNTPIIKASHEDHPAAQELIRLAYPRPYRSPIAPERVAAAVVRGIEGRSARIICPRRWAPVSASRGVVNILSDALIDRHRRMQALIRQLEG
ncbi:short-chain dehydrogenase/reductase [Catenulispora rubra]|uniref:short-chain dehydrogenase/reductase n=1 Tax=Catenulispora rubra TaxID=280293 RepID=UPI0018928083|nr:short-chain dehydrogenase/reductase [Catenulispora rubra]